MKTFLIALIFILASFSISSQAFADFDFSAVNAGTGTFNNGILSDFTWIAEGTINGTVQIRSGEVFDDGNKFEAIFGQANLADNLRIQVYPNGSGTVGDTILSTARLSILFDETTPSEGWGFCIVDIDVENCLISAINEHDEKVSYAEIDSWLVELFDANTVEEGMNVPKWDSTHAAILGFNTPDEYTVYNNLVLEGMQDSEAPSAYFMPNIPLKELIIDYENLQSSAYTSFHFFIASMSSTEIHEKVSRILKVYPNPAADVVQFHIPTLVNPCSIDMYDVNGRKLLEKQIPVGIKTFQIDVRNFKSGMYFCRFSYEEFTSTQKLLINP